jgi:hypothetical protein
MRNTRQPKKRASSSLHLQGRSHFAEYKRESWAAVSSLLTRESETVLHGHE